MNDPVVEIANAKNGYVVVCDRLGYIVAHDDGLRAAETDIRATLSAGCEYTIGGTYAGEYIIRNAPSGTIA